MARKSSKPEKEDLEKQRQALLKRRENLTNSLTTLSQEGKKAEKKGDNSDLAATSRDVELNFLLSDHERQELKAIDNALKRINEGTYGLCEECGDKISFKRLEALPFAKYCRDCQAEVEAREKLAMSTKHDDRPINLFSDAIKLAEQEEGSEEEEVPQLVDGYSDDIQTLEFEGKELEDFQEGEDETLRN